MRSFTNDGTRAELVVQGFFPNAYTASCWVEFTQSGTNVVVHHRMMKYVDDKVSSPDKSPYFGKRDLDDPSIATTAWGYNLSSAKLILERAPKTAAIDSAVKSGTTFWLRDAAVADIVGFHHINISGAYSTNGNAGVFCWKNNGNVATGQFQAFFGNGIPYTACCHLRFTQVGPDIAVEMAKAVFHYEPNSNRTRANSPYYGKDFDLIADAGTWNYYVTAAQIDLAPWRGAVSTFAGTGTAAGGRVVVGTNACVHVAQRHALPPSGTLDVQCGGQVVFDGVSSAYDFLTVRVARGGVVWAAMRDVFAPWHTYLDIRGGSVFLRNNGYLSQVLFTDGGEVGGTVPPYVGGYCNAYWRIRGSKPAVLSTGLRVFTDVAGRKFVIDVDDVTGDVVPDFTTTAGFTTWEKVRLTKIIKTGAGTWSATAYSGGLYNPVIVQEGELRLDTDHAFYQAGMDVGGIELAGGTLTAGTRHANIVKGLKVTADSTITVETNAVLMISDSLAATPWTGTLTIEGLAGTNLHFQAGQKALTPAQRAAIRVEGMPSRDGLWTLDKDGYLVLRSGLTVILQ